MSRVEPLSQEERDEIRKLHELGLGTRKIAKQLGRNRKTVKAVLEPQPRTVPVAAEKKLDPFLEAVAEKVGKGLTATRILREIRELGYRGGMTLLTSHIRDIKAPLAPKRKVKRRFETKAGLEMQVDWSPYRLPIGGREQVVHALAIVLGHSRRSFVVFFESQRLPRLLEGLERAFRFFGGVTIRVVFDNMPTVVLGRDAEGEPIWNPDFLPFVEHYGFDPWLCKVKDPDRKGIVEAFIGYLERDFVRGREPESLAELNRKAVQWLDRTANRRTHGTTGLVPDEVFEHERDFLIDLPEAHYGGAADVEYRQVGADSTISVKGVHYTVPCELANRQVRVRLYGERFEVLDRQGNVAFGREYKAPGDPRRLIIDERHYDSLPQSKGRRKGKTRKLEEHFLRRWPELGDFLKGLRLHMKSLTHVSLGKILSFAERYADRRVEEAMGRAHKAGLHTAEAVGRLLAAEGLPQVEPPISPLGRQAQIESLLEDEGQPDFGHYGYLDREVG